MTMTTSNPIAAAVVAAFDHRAALNETMRNDRTAALAITTSFAAPLLPTLGEEVTLCIEGEAATGKTTIARIAVSPWYPLRPSLSPHLPHSDPSLPMVLDDTDADGVSEFTGQGRAIIACGERFLFPGAIVCPPPRGLVSSEISPLIRKCEAAIGLLGFAWRNALTRVLDHEHVAKTIKGDFQREKEVRGSGVLASLTLTEHLMHQLLGIGENHGDICRWALEKIK